MPANETAFNFHLPIAIGSDHAGYEYKEVIKQLLEAKEFRVRDFGTYSTESVDYPEVAHPMAEALEKGDIAFGILLCGSGNGMAITANKHQQIRAALCWQEEIARLARQHNNANILCLPARFIDAEAALCLIKTFMQTPFEGGRHEKRVEKIPC